MLLRSYYWLEDMRMKSCSKCRIEKEDNRFYKNSQNRDGLSSWCNDCRVELARKNRRDRRTNKPFVFKAHNLKSSANSQGVPYDLTPEYLESIWTGRCAIFDSPITYEGQDGGRPTAEIDKIKPELGYVKGNVAWVCHRANRLKDNATVSELKKIILYLESTGGS